MITAIYTINYAISLIHSLSSVIRFFVTSNPPTWTTLDNENYQGLTRFQLAKEEFTFNKERFDVEAYKIILSYL